MSDSDFARASLLARIEGLLEEAADRAVLANFGAAAFAGLAHQAYEDALEWSDVQ